MLDTAAMLAIRPSAGSESSLATVFPLHGSRCRIPARPSTSARDNRGDAAGPCIPGHLQFEHVIRFLESSKQRMDRFPHQEVHRTVLDLQYHVVVKMAVEGHEIVVGGIGPVGGPVAPVLPAVVNETAPDDQAAVRLESGSQHVRTVGVVPAVCEGPCGLNSESALTRKPPKSGICSLSQRPFRSTISRTLSSRDRRVSGPPSSIGLE